MKKLIALLLAALMAATGALACAEAMPTPPLTVVNAITFDRDACRKIMSDMGLDAEQVELVESVLDLIEASGQKLIVVDDGFEYNVILGGNTIATLSGDFLPEGVSIGSNLFPHYILTVTNETINALLLRYTVEEQVEEASQSAGLLAELIASSQKYSDEMVEMIKSTVVIGEPVSGEYAVDGDTYNAMIPVSLDTRAIADGIVDLANQYIHSAPVVKLQAVLKSVDIDIPLEVPAIEDVPAVSATVYACQDESGNANGPLYVEAGVAEANGAPLIQAWVRIDGENLRVRFAIPEARLDVQYEQFQSDASGFKRLDVNVGEIYTGFALEASMGDESHLTFNVYYPDASKPLVSADLALIPGGQRQYIVAGKNKTVLSVEGLVDGTEENGSWLSLLADAALYSAMEIMSTANRDQPEVQNLIAQLRG